jgi:hypothetical protein
VDLEYLNVLKGEKAHERTRPLRRPGRCGWVILYRKVELKERMRSTT